ncbi:JAK2 [Lepeophtheirus salmonis]|uniref:JAK2 n=1 Tax=Lepeophtheirus salmonis TaxID=72036 RepID=A0A7R8CGF0_LEPSM|nr:JAK2 [Lepeophtheirus salmonis]CAF2810164.1 JAK2 [Lepeophtheirus salmonis]
MEVRYYNEEDDMGLYQPTTSKAAEFVISDICQYVLSMHPQAKYLFNLRNISSGTWLTPDKLIQERQILELRLRFKVPGPDRLLSIDPRAFQYFYLQVREDFKKGLVINERTWNGPDPQSSSTSLWFPVIEIKSATKLTSLTILIHMLSKSLTLKETLKNLSSYTPKGLWLDSVDRLFGQTFSNVTRIDRGSELSQVTLFVTAPFLSALDTTVEKDPELRLLEEGHKKTKDDFLVCTVEDICNISAGSSEEIQIFALELGRCLHPSEFDKDSGLLLCRSIRRLQTDVAMKMLKKRAALPMYGRDSGLNLENTLTLVHWMNSLENNSESIKEIELIEAAAGLARALWYLTEQRIVHGNIRCKSVFVRMREEDSFKVKLGDPGISDHSLEKDAFWLPPEVFSSFINTSLTILPEYPEIDTWAYSTTLWEIFAYGQSPHTQFPEFTGNKIANLIIGGEKTS